MNEDPSGPAEVLFQPFCGTYRERASTEAELVREIARPAKIFVDHVGSTSVIGLGGKPEIDLLATLQDWGTADAVISTISGLGYIKRESVIDPPRIYLSRLAGDGAKFNLHLTPADSEWGRNMLVFRDELSADPHLATRYAELKYRLAQLHPNDLLKYTDGKNEFVRDVLRRAAGAFSIDRLLTHQRAELDRSQWYQGWAIAAQLGLAVVASISVYSDDNRIQLNFAIIGFILAAIWLALSHLEKNYRNVGDQARRIALLTSGLGAQFSSQQRLRVFDRFTVSIASRPLQREEIHFASREPPGHTRLAELIEESAYWTIDLLRASASLVRWTLISVIGLLLSGFWLGLLTLPADTTVSIARVLVAILVFLLSSDVIGMVFAYRDATQSISEILQRIETASARGYPEADVLLLMADYNAAVESAPFALPYVFELRRNALASKWRNFLENKRR